MWFWLLFLLLIFAMPIGYGWGYRGWGPPYPRYWTTRRGRSVARSDVPPGDTYVESGWGVGADVLWLLVGIAALWFLFALIW